MTPIIHFRKHLTAPLPAVVAPGFLVRAFRSPDDIPVWLALRERAMAEERPTARSWTAAEFQREMTGKSWWRDDWTWVAVSLAGPQSLVGAVTLALREGAASTVPVVHWLLVDPAFRRRGIARLLMSHLEQAAWEAGWREVQLETHAGWSVAVAFYQSIGYAVPRDRSPR